MQLEYDRGHRNDLLDYLRSLDSNMVIISNLPVNYFVALLPS